MRGSLQILAPLETNNNKFIWGRALRGSLWCKPHQKLPLMPVFSVADTARGSWKRLIIQYLHMALCSALHRSFPFKLEFHQTPPLPRPQLRLSSYWPRENESHTNGNGFCSDWEFLLKLRAGFWPIKLVLRSAYQIYKHLFTPVDVWKEVTRISDNLLQIWTPSFISDVFFWWGPERSPYESKPKHLHGPLVAGSSIAPSPSSFYARTWDKLKIQRTPQVQFSSDQVLVFSD